jgi:hypothetical protein
MIFQVEITPIAEAQLQQAAALQGKDLATIVIEILMQVLAQEPKFLAPQPAKFMRFAGIAVQDAALMDALEQDIIRDRSSDLQRQLESIR